MRKNSDYVFVAIGAQKAARLNIEGNDLPGVTDPLEYLRRANSNQQLPVARNVVVIGGGNTAMDVARTVMHKSGGNCVVSIVYRRGTEDMPAAPDEIAACRAEGIRILELLSPVKIIGNEHGVIGLVCKRMRAGDPDDTGRRKPVEIPGSEFAMECDLIIPAVGQEKLIDFCEPALLQTRDRTLETRLPGVFAGGDVHGGPANIISAIADGKKAAEEILSKAGINESHRQVESNPDEISARMFRKGIRYNPGFDDNSAYQEDELSHRQAVEESERCLGCDELCSICVTVCPNRANVMYSIDNEPILLQKAIINPDLEIVFQDDITFTMAQKIQVFNLADFCNECGNCTTFCPAAGKPFADKPRFFMNLEKFRNASDGFFLNYTPDKKVLIRKRDSKISTLSLKDGKYYYENEMVMACFIGEEFDMIHVRFYDQNLKEYTFEEAAEMRLLIKTFSWFTGSAK